MAIRQENGRRTKALWGLLLLIVSAASGFGSDHEPDQAKEKAGPIGVEAGLVREEEGPLPTLKASQTWLDGVKDRFLRHLPLENYRYRWLRRKAEQGDFEAQQELWRFLPESKTRPQILLEVRTLSLAASQADALGLGDVFPRLARGAPLNEEKEKGTGTRPIRPLARDQSWFSRVLSPSQQTALIAQVHAAGEFEPRAVQSISTLSGRHEAISPRAVPRLWSKRRQKPAAKGPAVASLEILPYLFDDDYSIQLTSTAIIRSPTRLTNRRPEQDPKTPGGDTPDNTLPPRRAVGSAILFDGQTLLLGHESLLEAHPQPDVDPEEQEALLTVVLITPTVIDPAGNRVNSKADLPADLEEPPEQSRAALPEGPTR